MGHQALNPCTKLQYVFNYNQRHLVIVIMTLLGCNGCGFAAVRQTTVESQSMHVHVLILVSFTAFDTHFQINLVQ